jgi:hypothetical protein
MTAPERFADTAGPLSACALALISAQASAQAGATAPAVGHPEVDQKAVPSEPQRPTANPPTADDVYRTLEEAAAETNKGVFLIAPLGTPLTTAWFLRMVARTGKAAGPRIERAVRECAITSNSHALC